MKPICVNCLYFYKNLHSKDLGECRLNPPTPVATNKAVGWIGAEFSSELIYKSVWPQVKDDDWCHSFKSPHFTEEK